MFFFNNKEICYVLGKENCPLLQLFYFITYFIILLSNVKIINSLSCSKNDLFSNSNCFNDILAFNDAKYRAGHSSTNKDGVFIIEFSVDSESGNRLFYGLKSNGRYYFSVSQNGTRKYKGEYYDIDIKSDSLQYGYHDGKPIIKYEYDPEACDDYQRRIYII